MVLEKIYSEDIFEKKKFKIKFQFNFLFITLSISLQTHPKTFNQPQLNSQEILLHKGPKNISIKFFLTPFSPFEFPYKSEYANRTK